jgi:hypothetical protein
MLDIEVRGGLGDLFIYFHDSTAWEDIENLAPDERARVTIISHNPFADELFKWHPKAAQIEIVKSRHFFHEYDSVEARRAAGVQDHAPIGRPGRERKPIRFYPSPEDLKIMNADLPTEPYLVIAPTASGMEIENRNIPATIVTAVCSAALLRGIPVVFVGRTYQGPHAPKEVSVRPYGELIVDFTDRLSVPGTAEVVWRSRATVCAHSALLLLSWFNRIPNMALYPPKYKHHDFDNPSPFGFGKDFQETARMLFSEFVPSRFSTFLSANFKRGNLP